jgi:hypothetical protein
MRLLEPLSMQRNIRKLILGSGYTPDGRYFVNPTAWHDAQVVVVHRNFPSAATMPLIRKISESGVRLIYETDDAFQLLSDDHPKAFHRASAPYINETAHLADVVVVATQELASLYSDCESVVVLPNMLSPRIWGKAAQPALDDSARHLRVALVGGMDHFADFSILRTLVQQAKFIDWVCYGDGAIKAIESFGAQPALTIPSNFHYESHPTRLRSLAADIAVCPLLDTAFNRCKSDIKFIEFGYLGVPIVASSLPGYTKTINNGHNGYLCSDESSWLACFESIFERRSEVSCSGETAQEQIIKERMLNSEGCVFRVFSDILIGREEKNHVA